MSSSATLIAGVGTLLLALGVGVLIGHDSSASGTQRSPAAQIITVGGGGAAAAAPAAATPAATAAKKATSKKSSGGSSNAFSGIKTVKALPPPTVTIGGKCSNGQAGCQNGKFTGNFFGQ